MTEYQVCKAPPWSKKKYFIRRKRRFDKPSKNEVLNRIRFATVATKLYGETGYTDDGLPVVAGKLKQEMKALPPIGRRKVVLTGSEVRSLQRDMARKGISTIQLDDRYEIRRQLP